MIHRMNAKTMQNESRFRIQYLILGLSRLHGKAGADFALEGCLSLPKINLGYNRKITKLFPPVNTIRDGEMTVEIN